MRLLLLLMLLGANSVGIAEPCTLLAASQKDALVGFLKQRFNLAKDTKLTLTKDQEVGNSCYRELTFEGTTAFSKWQVTMYLSPDQRFLTSELMDTTINPFQQAHKDAMSAMAGLAQNHGSSKGPEDASVTLVEFSDFECPFCRRLAQIMDEVLPEHSDQVRIIFHHMPLSMHPWARAAAEGAACAQLQNSEGFWAIHDQLFLHQSEITPTNMRQKLLEYAGAAKSLDVTTFKSCIEEEMSLGAVLKDLNLAKTYDVNSTPTLFVNGERIGGVRDADQLRQIIAKAVTSTASTAASPSPNPSAADRK